MSYAASGLAVIALVPYVAFVDVYLRQVRIRRAGDGRTRRPQLAITTRQFITTTWLMGFFFLQLVLSWFVATDTQSWSHLGAFPLKATIFIIWVIMGACLSIGFVVLGGGLAWFGRRLPRAVTLGVVLPTLWLLCEFVRSWLFSVIAYGHNGSIGAFWNFGAVGFAAAGTWIVYAGRLLGLFGLSGLIVLINVGFFWLLRRQWRSGAVVLGIAAILMSLGFGLYHHSGTHQLQVATVQLPSDATNYFDTLNEAAARVPALQKRPADLLALPEYSYFFDYARPEQAARTKQIVFHNQPGLLTYSRKDYAPGMSPYNQVVAMSDTGATISAQHKSFLIPTGEYLPGAITTVFRWLGMKDINTSFKGTIEVSKSSVREVPVSYRGTTYGVLACSGVIAPQLYQRLGRLGADIFVNDASLNEFRDAAVYHQEARQFARFIAVANDRPLVQAARGGYSYIISRDGAWLYRSPHNGVRIGAAQVESGGPRTLYSWLGEWVVDLAALILIILAIIPDRLHFRQHK